MKTALILPLFLLPVFSEKKPNIVVIIVDDLGENSTSDGIHKFLWPQISINMTKDNRHQYDLQAGQMCHGTTQNQWQRKLEIMQSENHHLHHGDCHDDEPGKGLSWRDTMSTQSVLHQGLLFSQAAMLGPWEGHYCHQHHHHHHHHHHHYRHRYHPSRASLLTGCYAWTMERSSASSNALSLSA